MIGVVLGFLGGYVAGAFMVALLKAAADEPDAQLPTLGTGTWLVCINRHGEMSKCEPHVCFEAAFERLEEAMRKDEA